MRALRSCCETFSTIHKMSAKTSPNREWGLHVIQHQAPRNTPTIITGALSGTDPPAAISLSWLNLARAHKKLWLIIHTSKSCCSSECALIYAARTPQMPRGSSQAEAALFASYSSTATCANIELVREANPDIPSAAPNSALLALWTANHPQGTSALTPKDDGIDYATRAPLN